ncbi:MAG: CHASE domain-containing protein, partial [Ferrovibrionaceae bacterium]
MATRLRARHSWQLALVALIGLAVSVAIFRSSLAEQERRARFDLTAQADWQAADLSSKLRDTADFGAALAALFSTGLEVDQQAFERFAALRAEDETVLPRGIAWLPRVPDQDRDAFEIRASYDIRPDYRIVDRPVAGEPPAPRRPVYFPILYASVFSGARAQLGYDVLRSPHGGPAIRKAIDTGQTVVARPQPQEGIAAAGPVFV